MLDNKYYLGNIKKCIKDLFVKVVVLDDSDQITEYMD